MAILDTDVFFSGSPGITNNDLGRFEVANFASDVDDCLIEHCRWKRNAVAGVGLSLSPDNLRVASGTFITRGDLGIKPKRMAANTIWSGAGANISLHLDFPSANVFQFDSGGLWSNFVPSSQVEHGFYDTTEGRNGRALLNTDERLVNTEPGFCLRMVCQLSNTSSASKGVIIKAVILLFPSSADTIDEAVESKFPGWPGLKIGEAFIPMKPTPTSPWQCPILPFIKPVSPFTEDDVAPTCSKLREAIAGIMQNARQHDGLKSGAEVFAKWGKIRANPTDMLDKAPSLTWPDARDETVEDESGKQVSFCDFYLYNVRS
jgi:hypothetical protein